MDEAELQQAAQQNFDIFDFQLTAEDIVELTKLDTGYRLNWDPTHVA